MKHVSSFKIEKNSFVDAGDGILEFPEGLTITDDSVQKNGTRYDIPSMDISSYKGQLTADHDDRLSSLIGHVSGIVKEASRIAVRAIRFAVNENPYARLAYNLAKGGFLTDFSIETIGSIPDDYGTYYNSRLVGLSAVVSGNNDNAYINSIVRNSITEAKEAGLDTADLEKMIEGEEMDEETKVETPEVAPEAPEAEVEAEVVEAPVEEVKAETEAVENKINALLTKIEKLEKALDADVEEPKFVKSENKMTTNKSSQYAGMDWRERTAAQVNALWDAERNGSADAREKLYALNSIHLDELKSANVVKNTMTIADMGNFVIAPEMLTEIEGHRSNYLPLLNSVAFRDTLSLQMAWLTRDGDIDMQEVDMCEGQRPDGNLKPGSEYAADINTSNLSEVAAVTPVCNAATRFLAADLLGDVAAGYRNDYDRKRAQLVIARLQQAVNQTGNSLPAHGAGTDTTSLIDWIDVMAEVSETAQNGTYIFNYSTYMYLLKNLISAGANGPLSGLFTTGDQQAILGRPYIVVPNDLMPSLSTGGTLDFTVDGVNVMIDAAVLYADLSTFTGRTSGGLNYVLSSDASYEINGQVRSAFQRNEVILRGSFFRGGAVRDANKVASLIKSAGPVS